MKHVFSVAKYRHTGIAMMSTHTQTHTRNKKEKEKRKKNKQGKEEFNCSFHFYSLPVVPLDVEKGETHVYHQAQ